MMKKQWMLPLGAVAVTAGLGLKNVNQSEVELQAFVRQHQKAIHAQKESMMPALSDCTDTISFANQIKPLIDLNCSTSRCHSFPTHESIEQHAFQIIDALQAANGTVLMPYGGPALADSSIQQFSCWISQGRLNN